jgi:hypothetical protein
VLADVTRHAPCYRQRHGAAQPFFQRLASGAAQA